jgi:sulfur-oxidizing protein SoxX
VPCLPETCDSLNKTRRAPERKRADELRAIICTRHRAARNFDFAVQKRWFAAPRACDDNPATMRPIQRAHAPTRAGWSLATACAVFAACANTPLPPPAPSPAAAPPHWDAIATPLAPDGDAARGRALVLARDPANCILCHAAPGARFAGDLAPPLDGTGSRLTPAQLRARIVDNARLNPRTIMPSYHRTAGLARVAAAYRERPILTAQQVEDLVAYLASLK